MFAGLATERFGSALFGSVAPGGRLSKPRSTCKRTGFETKKGGRQLLMRAAYVKPETALFGKGTHIARTVFPCASTVPWEGDTWR